MNKPEALAKLKERGYDGAVIDSIIYIYTDKTPATAAEIQKICKEIGYTGSFGLRKSTWRTPKYEPDAQEQTAEDTQGQQAEALQEPEQTIQASGQQDPGLFEDPFGQLNLFDYGQ
jgi:hypothetical protein